MARAYPLEFKRSASESMKAIFGPHLTETVSGRQARDAVSTELLGIAPTGRQWMYQVDYARAAFEAAPRRRDFRSGKAWQMETLPILAEWAKTDKARNILTDAITGYYSKIGQYAVKLDGFGDRLYIPNPAADQERPLDYVGISPSDTKHYLHYDRVQVDRHAYVPLLPDDSSQGVLGLGRWNIPGIQTPGTRDSIIDAFEQIGTIRSNAGVELSTLSLFHASEISIGQTVLHASELPNATSIPGGLE